MHVDMLWKERSKEISVTTTWRGGISVGEAAPGLRHCTFFVRFLGLPPFSSAHLFRSDRDVGREIEGSS